MKKFFAILVCALPVIGAHGQDEQAETKVDMRVTYTGTTIYFKDGSDPENMPLGVTATVNAMLDRVTGLAFQASYSGKQYEEYEADGIDLTNNVYAFLVGASTKWYGLWSMLLAGVERQSIRASAFSTRESVSEHSTGFAYQAEIGTTIPQKGPFGMTLSVAYRNSFYDEGGSHDWRYNVGLTLRW